MKHGTRQPVQKPASLLREMLSPWAPRLSLAMPNRLARRTEVPLRSGRSQLGRESALSTYHMFPYEALLGGSEMQEERSLI
jgi:hypothetical protein